jgi:hypothetical protein
MPKNPYNFTPSTLKGQLPRATGDVIFVDSATGSVNGDGSSLRPFNKIDSAFNKSGLSAGDIIVVMPGHTETGTAAAHIAADVAGVTVLGLGTGNLRPLITLGTATTADIDIDAANIRFENLRFDFTGFDAIAAPLDVNAAGFQLVNCEVELADASAQATLGILTDANASDMIVEGCYFFGSADAGTATAIRIVGGDSIIVRNNIFVGNYTTTLGAVQNVTTPCTNTFIVGNLIDNRTASAAVGVTMHASSTGIIADNRIQVLTGTAPIVAAAMSWVGGNYYAATIGTAGTLI